MVGERDPYVIAVNAGAVPLAFAGADIPVILRAVLGIGHQQVTLDRATAEVVDVGWSTRPIIRKRRGTSATASEQGSADDLIRTTLFATPEHAGISAALYSTAHVGTHPGIKGLRWGEDFVLVHNPFAASPLPRGLLPHGREFDARQDGDMLEVEETEESVAQHARLETAFAGGEQDARVLPQPLSADDAPTGPRPPGVAPERS